MTSSKQPASDETRQGRLSVRPRMPESKSRPGMSALNLGTARDGLVYVPESYDAATPAPLVLMLHGAGGDARNALNPLSALAEEEGTILLAVSSHNETWDIIRGQYGPDVTLINRALGETFGRYAVDPAHVGVEGFSDGASYALSIGLANGDLFTHIIAFSPGFMAPLVQIGEPRIFISHGLHDRTLPIDACSRRIVPRLERAGYDVTYEEFEGPHTVPQPVARAALAWFLAETE